MNTTNEPDQADEPHEALTKGASREPFEPEPSNSKEAPEVREMAERGYGWGV